MKGFVFIFLAAIMQAIGSPAQDFKKASFISQSDTLRYRLLYPINFDPLTAYPLVLFLHGSGARGSDNEKQLTNVPAVLTDSINRVKYPCFLLAPQCSANDVWVNFPDFPKSLKATDTPTTAASLTLSVIEDVSTKMNIDRKRIYITGYSMGGEGTLDLISRRPDLFAAAIPICPVADTSKVARISAIPLWIFHGDQDKVNDALYSRIEMSALKRAGGKPKYTEYPGIGHQCWTKAYSQPGLLDWLFSQKK